MHDRWNSREKSRRLHLEFEAVEVAIRCLDSLALPPVQILQTAARVLRRKADFFRDESRFEAVEATDEERSIDYAICDMFYLAEEVILEKLSEIAAPHHTEKAPPP
jgi:hypothetical protein